MRVPLLLVAVLSANVLLVSCDREGWLPDVFTVALLILTFSFISVDVGLLWEYSLYDWHSCGDACYRRRLHGSQWLAS
jgi:hypothetical protein